MNSRKWWRVVEHPYQGIRGAQKTHGHLRPTRVRVPPFSTFAIPFNWMLRDSQERLDEELPTPLPPDETPPFNTAWVFGRERQEAFSECSSVDSPPKTRWCSSTPRAGIRSMRASPGWSWASGAWCR